MRLKNESLIFWVLKIFSFLVQRLPLAFTRAVFAPVMGWGAYTFLPKKRRIVHANLTQAFGAQMSPKEIRQLTRRNFVSFARNVIEIFYSPVLTHESLRRLVALEGEEYIEAALKQGRGVIFLAMHSGNWEWASLVGSSLGHPYRILANPQKKDSRVSLWLHESRRKFGAEVIFPGFGSKEIIKSLKDNQIVSMVIDQGGKEGENVTFFGRRASMSTGAIRLGLKYDVPICPVLISRDRDGRHRLCVFAPVKLIKTQNTDEDVISNLEKIVPFYENAIRQNSDEYMWFYKVWKYTDEFKVVILEDGKTGHLRQSEAVAFSLKKLLEGRHKKVVIEAHRIEFKSELARRLCALHGALAQFLPFLRGIDGLKRYVSMGSFDAISKTHGDFIISCGSSLAAANYLLKCHWGVKNIVVLTPGLMGQKSFDRIILPQHDARSKRKDERIICTRMAPNLISPNYIQGQSEALLNHYSHLKGSFRNKIGVLIGGPTKGVEMTEERVQLVLHQVKEAANELNMDVILTTSRRTPANIEALITRELKRFERCPLFIIANKNNTPEAVGGIFGLSDILIVSGESISMVSEAVSSGKKTIVFSLSGSDALVNTKYERFIHQLHDQGHVVGVAPANIAQTIYSLVKNKIHTKPVHDQQVIMKGLEHLVA